NSLNPCNSMTKYNPPNTLKKGYIIELNELHEKKATNQFVKSAQFDDQKQSSNTLKKGYII
ncbi:MAG: hypothetical protein KAS71_13160, partial [Bacteroidales bacterium]|nr:hypothetical protein [Bacteroidales bacterium]